MHRDTRGLKVEDQFVIDFEKHTGKSPVTATLEEQKIFHWDVSFEGIKYEVKSMKRRHRLDTVFDNTIIWIELKGITGFPGWLFGGADYFVFEQPDTYLVVPANVLRNFVKTVYDRATKVNRPQLYKRYQRKDRLDELTLIKQSDLENLAESRVPKTKHIE